MADVLNVTARDQLGSAKTRRLRSQGFVPAVLYGHGEGSVSLSVQRAEINAVIRHGGQLVNLQGAVNESALLKEVQWDALGSDVLHIDLARVKAGESVAVTVPVELRGEAPGTKVGGVVSQALHQLDIECPATSIPEKIEVTINTLELGDALTVADMELPDDVTTTASADALVVQCVEPVTRDDDEETTDISAEPEVIGKSDKEEDEGGGD